MPAANTRTKSNIPIMATEVICSGSSWPDSSLLNLLRKGRPSSEEGAVSEIDMIVVDNAKAHRKLSGRTSQSTATMTPTSSLDDSDEDLGLFLDSLFEEKVVNDANYLPPLQLVNSLHHSFPIKRHTRRKRRGSSSRAHHFQWGSSSDSEIGARLTLDDMLHEECGGHEHSQVTSNVQPRRPVRQASLELPLDEEFLHDSEHSQYSTENSL